MPSMYVVNPRADCPGYYSAEVFSHLGMPGAALIADLSSATVAALAPADFDVRMVEENVAPIDFDVDADFVAITGKVSQWGRMQRIAAEFRRRGRPVLIGGPFASLCPEQVRPHCDVLVRGEAESIAGELFSDLRRGRPKDEYQGDRPDLETSPAPRWDLYPNSRALMACVQTSRGCPFECEFCDVIQYLGRKQRHKSVSRVLAELDEAYRRGYRVVFLADDNFTVYRSRAKELLEALASWNRKREDGHVEFLTQVSIDAARDDELLRMCSEAGLTRAFVGIETPNEDSLRETKKRQNLGVSLTDQVQRFLDYGISLMGGMMVGFDSDGPDIFERQLEFAMSTVIPIFSLGALVAPAATPLYERLEREGRLTSRGTQVEATPWDTNVVPKGMSQEQLLSGMRWLANRLYDPAAFAERVVNMVERLGPRLDPNRHSARQLDTRLRPVEADALTLVARLSRMGPEEARMYSAIYRAVSRRRDAANHVLPALMVYVQVRYMYEMGSFWDPSVAREPTPAAVEPAPALPLEVPIERGVAMA